MSRRLVAGLIACAIVMVPACNKKKPVPPSTTELSTPIVEQTISTQKKKSSYTYQPAPVKNSAPLYWDWSLIDEQQVSFPEDFLWGVATSAHQVEGNCTHNDWCLWEADGNVQEITGAACDHWNRYKEDIALMKSLGINTFRFSIEWSKIEPKPGIINQEALAHYEDVCKELVSAGIKPLVTLHHYTSPAWFALKGGFEEEDNVTHFVNFATIVFERLHPYVHAWLTFNSPTSYVARCYYKKMAYPGGKASMQRAQEVLKNILNAHVQTYHTLKQLDGGATSRIGILHNIYQVEPGTGWFDSMGCKAARSLFDENVYQFFTTGTVKISVPFTAKISYRNPQAPQSLDFIGLNYYSHGLMQNRDVAAYPGDAPTDNEIYTIYPEGLYRAIVDISDNLAKPLGIPIYITENGISTSNEKDRELFFKRYLYALSQALHEGHDVRGYIVWSLMDNYEWGTYQKKYGLCSVDYATQKRSLKPGSQYYIDVIKNHSKEIVT